MNVGQLIDELMKHPMDQPVYTYDATDDVFNDVEAVTEYGRATLVVE